MPVEWTGLRPSHDRICALDHRDPSSLDHELIDCIATATGTTGAERALEPAISDAATEP